MEFTIIVICMITVLISAILAWIFDEDGFFIIAAVAIVVLILVFIVGLVPVKEKEYTKNLDSTFVFDKNDPYKSMGLTLDATARDDYTSLEFVSYNGDGREMYLNDYISLVDDAPIKFKEGAENKIHYIKDINCFGDEIISATKSVIIEYKAAK